jgi:hypothetical protein
MFDMITVTAPVTATQVFSKMEKATLAQKQNFKTQPSFFFSRERLEVSQTVLKKTYNGEVYALVFVLLGRGTPKVFTGSYTARIYQFNCSTGVLDEADSPAQADVKAFIGRKGIDITDSNNNIEYSLGMRICTQVNQ